MKKETRGGKRTGAGRKPSPDKKLTVSLYIETSKIEKAGGMEKMKERLYAFLEVNEVASECGVTNQELNEVLKAEYDSVCLLDRTWHQCDIHNGSYEGCGNCKHFKE